MSKVEHGSTNGNGNGNGKGLGAVGQLGPGTDEIQHQMQALVGRDLQLWSITLLVVVVLSAGFLSLVAPNLVSHPGLFLAEGRYLPQLFFGLTSLILLFNLYIIFQKKELNATRRALMQELILNERLEGFSLMDPLTQLLNRRAMEQMLAKEVARTNRTGGTLTLLMIELDNFKTINTRLGGQGGDNFLVEAARLVKNNFRGSDIVFRYNGDEFLVVMPDTTEQQAEIAVQRLLMEVERWNVESRTQCEMSLSWGLASYVPGAKITDTLHAAQRKVLLKQQKLSPVF
jgi:diguanylate cyclase (GGDEF)-like protein